ncbi:MAG: excisionase family DNA-binding protein [Chloroflexi bacterium]|nr:excisionase family DNA-binding protein [Chloroflexota bacterium]
MTVKELSEYLRLDRMTIYKMLKEGSIPASRIGHQWRFFREDIDEWIRSLRAGNRTSVLVVDADPAVRGLFDSELPADSFEVIATDSGEESQNLVSQRQFDVVFLELKRSTLETFKQVRAANSAVPVVILASSSDGRLVDQAMDVGAFTLARKPAKASDVRYLMEMLALRNGQSAS